MLAFTSKSLARGASRQRTITLLGRFQSMPIAHEYATLILFVVAIVGIALVALVTLFLLFCDQPRGATKTFKRFLLSNWK